MKRFALVSFSTIALAIAASLPATATAPVILPQSAMSFSFNSPFVSSSGLQGEHHLIRVMVLGMSLEDLMVLIPPQMAKFSSIIVKDESGKTIPAKISRAESRVAVVFDQPVAPGRTIELDFTNGDTAMEQGEILLYRITAKQAGINTEIPIGTARIQVPSHQ